MLKPAYQAFTKKFIYLEIAATFSKFNISLYHGKRKKIFDDAELELLKEGMKRTYKERFEMATRLYKIQRTIKKATITHKPFIKK